MFVKPMGKLHPPSVKIGLTAEEARVLLHDLCLLQASLVGTPAGEDVALVDRLLDLIRKLEAATAP